MDRKVSHLYRYPVKGLSAELLQEMTLEPGRAVPIDRRFAITHANSQFNFDTRNWMARRNFLVVAHSPSLTSISAAYDEGSHTLTLHYLNSELLSVALSDPELNNKLNAALANIDTLQQKGPYYFVESSGMQFTDSPTATVSLMNLQSLHELEQSMEQPLNPTRFRGNVWFDGVAAWEEQGWVGKELMLGNARVRVTETIDRCSAIDAEPGLGKRNLAVLKTLNSTFNRNQFGVLVEVLEGGRWVPGSELTVL